jgi:hypothetical protein
MIVHRSSGDSADPITPLPRGPSLKFVPFVAVALVALVIKISAVDLHCSEWPRRVEAVGSGIASLHCAVPDL